MTTNKGAENKDIGFIINKENINTELKETFNIAFINRIDDIITFNQLKSEDIKQIIIKKINELKEKYSNINIKIEANIINELIEETKYKEYGARKIDKILKTNVENIIIDNILEDKKEINIDSIFSK